ncbi:CD180 antigen-like isoform X3 [Haemaphysalis longicornis]
MAASLLRSLLSAVPLALLIAMCQSAQGSRYCPSKEIIYPCGCTQTRLGPRVLCTAVNNEQTLRTVLAYLSSYKLNAFTLRHINFTTTPDLFSGLRAVTVKIQDSVFRMHNSNSLRPFAVAGDVQDLDVRESFLDLGNSNLAVMHGLKYVTVRASSIGLLQKRWFDGMEGLNKLTIESTRLGGLEDNALAGLTEVEDISLVADTLEHLRRSYFPEHATRLTRLDFSDNRLTSLPPDMFDNMPVLASVTLTHNKFKTLPPTPWRPMLRQLTHVTLDDNPIVCNANISWLLESDTRHKVSGACEEPPNMHGVRLEDLDASRLPR